MSVTPYSVNRGCLQVTYFKLAEYEDILVQIIYAIFKNEWTKDNG